MKAKEKAIARLIFREGIFRIKESVLTRGEKSPFYVNLRGPNISEDLMGGLAQEMKRLVQDVEFSCVVGVPTAGDDFARALCLSTGQSLLVLDKFGRVQEGEFSYGQKVVAVENVTTSGYSVINFVHMLRAKGMMIEDVIILVDREQGAIKRLSGCNIRPHVLFSVSDLLDLYRDEEMIVQKQHEEVVGYLAKYKR